jgi:hypothetical protein
MGGNLGLRFGVNGTKFECLENGLLEAIFGIKVG